MRPSTDRGASDVRVVEIDDVAVGTVALATDDDGSLRIVSMEIEPNRRSQGIGTRVVQALDEEAARAGVALTLRIGHDHRARPLFDRLGFSVAAADDTHVELRRE